METAAVSISTEVIIFPPISRMDTSSCCPDTWETAMWSTQSGTAGYRRETAVWPLTWFKNCHDFYFILNKRLFLASGKPYTRKDHCLVPDIIKILIFIFFFFFAIKEGSIIYRKREHQLWKCSALSHRPYHHWFKEWGKASCQIFFSHLSSDKLGARRDRCKDRVNKCIQTATLGNAYFGISILFFS